MMKNRDGPPRRRRIAKPEKSKRLPPDNASPRRIGKVRLSLRDRLTQNRRRGRSIRTSKLRKRRLRAAKTEVISRDQGLPRKNDLPPSKKFRERDLVNDTRPVRGYELSNHDNASSYRNDGFSQRKLPERSDLYFLDYMHEVNEKYRTVHPDDLLLKKNSRSDRRDLRYQDDISFGRRSIRDKHDKYSRPESPPKKYIELDKYEKRFREHLSPYKRNDNFEPFSKYHDTLSFSSNSRPLEKYDKFSTHENHSSSRRSVYSERPRKHDGDLFLSPRNSSLPKTRDRHSNRLSPLLSRNFMKEFSPQRRVSSERYDRRKELPPSRIPSLLDKLPRYETPPSPKRYDKHNDPYPRRRDMPEERRSRNHSPSLDRNGRKKYAENSLSRPLHSDRHVKYGHNHLSPPRRSVHPDRFDSPPPPPPPPPPPRRSDSVRRRRSRDPLPPPKPVHTDRRDRPPSPRRNSRPEKRDRNSTDYLPPRDEKRPDKYFEPTSHSGDPSRSSKSYSRKSAYPDRFDPPAEPPKKYPPPLLDKRDKHLAEMAHSSKTNDSKSRSKRNSRPEPPPPPEQYARSRDSKQSRNAAPPMPPTNSKRKRSDAEAKRPPKRNRPRSPARDRRDKYPQDSVDTRSTFRKSRPKPDKRFSEERWGSRGRSV